MFNCDNDFESDSSYLKADYRLECDGDEYDGYLGYTIFMIFIYPIGIPLFYFICLWLKRGDINGSIDIESSNGIMNDLSADSGAMSRTIVRSESNSTSLKAYSKEVSRRFSIERACLNPVTSPYSSLFVAYKPELWYWECVECVRRLSLTGLLVFMYPGSEKQVLLAMLICFIWMIIYSNVQPYIESSHSFFMMSAQWGVLLQLYAVFLIINHSFDSSSELIGGSAVTVGVTVFAFGIWSILRSGLVKLALLKKENKEVELEAKGV